MKSQVVELDQLTFEAQVEDGLSLLVLCECPVGTLAILECLAEIPSELREAVWASVPQEKYRELQQWAIALLLDGDRIEADQLFPNELTITQRVLKAFRALPPELKKQIWASLPMSRREELRAIA